MPSFGSRKLHLPPELSCYLGEMACFDNEWTALLSKFVSFLRTETLTTKSALVTYISGSEPFLLGGKFESRHLFRHIYGVIPSRLMTNVSYIPSTYVFFGVNFTLLDSSCLIERNIPFPGVA